MHSMSSEAFRFHRRKCAEADMQRQEANSDTARADFVKQAFSKMQSGGGRGDRASWIGKCCLVALVVQIKSIADGAGNVRRQRNFAEQFKHPGDISCASKA